MSAQQWRSCVRVARRAIALYNQYAGGRRATHIDQRVARSSSCDDRPHEIEDRLRRRCRAAAERIGSDCELSKSGASARLTDGERRIRVLELGLRPRAKLPRVGSAGCEVRPHELEQRRAQLRAHHTDDCDQSARAGEPHLRSRARRERHNRGQLRSTLGSEPSRVTRSRGRAVNLTHPAISAFLEWHVVTDSEAQETRRQAGYASQSGSTPIGMSAQEK